MKEKTSYVHIEVINSYIRVFYSFGGFFFTFPFNFFLAWAWIFNFFSFISFCCFFRRCLTKLYNSYSWLNFCCRNCLAFIGRDLLGLPRFLCGSENRFIFKHNNHYLSLVWYLDLSTVFPWKLFFYEFSLMYCDLWWHKTAETIQGGKIFAEIR